MSVFTVVVSALEYLEGDRDGKARNYLLSIHPKALLCHHFGDDGACTRKCAEISDNISTSQTM